MIVFKPALVCRPALPKDTQAMLELTSHIWEGEDYVPRVWQDWLVDTNGLLVVVEYGTRIAALGKLTRQLTDSWWLEGLRVHPDFEGKGVATHLFAYLHNHWLEQGSGVLRLSTMSSNLPVHRICAKFNLSKISEFSPFRAAILPGYQTDSFIQLTEDQVDLAMNIAYATESQSEGSSLAFSHGLMDLGWVWVGLNKLHLAEAARKSRLWAWHGNQGLLSAWPEVDDGPTVPYVMVFACPVPLLPEMLLDYRRLAGNQGYPAAGWNAPLHPGLLPILEQAGFKRYWDEGSVYIYETQHLNVV